MTDDDAWFCVRPNGPRWQEFDQPFRHVCNLYLYREGPPSDANDTKELLTVDELIADYNAHTGAGELPRPKGKATK